MKSALSSWPFEQSHPALNSIHALCLAVAAVMSGNQLVQRGLMGIDQLTSALFYVGFVSSASYDVGDQFSKIQVRHSHAHGLSQQSVKTTWGWRPAELSWSDHAFELHAEPPLLSVMAMRAGGAGQCVLCVRPARAPSEHAGGRPHPGPAAADALGPPTRPLGLQQHEGPARPQGGHRL